MEVNGNVHPKDSQVVLRGGDELVFSPSGKHSYVSFFPLNIPVLFFY